MIEEIPIKAIGTKATFDAAEEFFGSILHTIHDGNCVWCGDKRDIPTSFLYGYENKYISFCEKCNENLKGMMKK